MKWDQDTLVELNRIGGTTQAQVKKLFAKAIRKRQEAAKLQEEVNAIIVEANEAAETAFAYMVDEDTLSIKDVTGNMLIRKRNTPSKSFDKKALKISLIEHLNADLVTKLFKEATKEGKKPEKEFSIAFKPVK